MQQPTVSYTGHPHLLAVLDDAPRHAPPCNECGRPCDSPPVFRCARCDFNLHLLCGPLPTTIELDEFPGDPFSLADSFAEDDSGEYYCDFCEDKRDPRECVYHSGDYYFVHFKCAMSEVLRSLKGERGDVDLRTLGKLIPGRVVSKGLNSQTTAQWEKQITESTLTLKDIYDSLTENELMEFKNLSIPSADISSDYATSFPYSGDAFKQLLDRLDAVTLPWEELIKLYNLDTKVVDVGEHQITWDFANIMDTLLRKHKDLIAESRLSPKVKTFMFVLLCDVVYSMSRTKIEDVTEQMLMDWWGRLKVVQRANFRMQLVRDQLTIVVSAYFGLAANKFNERATADLDEQIDKLSKELEQVRENREQHQKLVESASTIIEKCLDDASALSYKTVGADLL
ncbi:uncharacterized protein LOC130135244 [Syzygium oleosum]|uniref:uncharacterized protein LOC130135244 n=1 Tax=Syzygium oleosum TaxID=219896 RepID=UPI0024B8E4C6|nr:uncharacterized protein LOC130135244 [Syzygium oleosum]